MRLLLAAALILSALSVSGLPSVALAANPCGEAPPARDVTGLTMKGAQTWEGEKTEDWKVIFQKDCKLSYFSQGEWQMPGTWTQTPDGIRFELNGWSTFTGAWTSGRDIAGTQVNVVKKTGVFKLTRTKAYDGKKDLDAAVAMSLDVQKKQAEAAAAAAAPRQAPTPPPMSARGPCGAVRDAYSLAGNKYRGNVRWDAKDEPVDLIVTLRSDCSVTFVEDGVQGAGKWAQDGRELILILGDSHEAYKGKLDGTVFDGAVNDQRGNFGNFTLRLIG